MNGVRSFSNWLENSSPLIQRTSADTPVTPAAAAGTPRRREGLEIRERPERRRRGVCNRLERYVPSLVGLEIREA
jgi:hypothetical protein